MKDVGTLKLGANQFILSGNTCQRDGELYKCGGTADTAAGKIRFETRYFQAMGHGRIHEGKITADDGTVLLQTVKPQAIVFQ